MLRHLQAPRDASSEAARRVTTRAVGCSGSVISTSCCEHVAHPHLLDGRDELGSRAADRVGVGAGTEDGELVVAPAPELVARAHLLADRSAAAASAATGAPKPTSSREPLEALEADDDRARGHAEAGADLLELDEAALQLRGVASSLQALGRGERGGVDAAEAAGLPRTAVMGSPLDADGDALPG